MAYARHPDQPDKMDFNLVDGVAVKSMHFRHAGMVVPQHAHAYDHLTFIAAGAVRVFADDALVGEFTAPAPLVIRARVKHRFVTLAPGTTILCIHNADRAGCNGCAGCIEGVAIAAEHHLEGVA